MDYLEQEINNLKQRLLEVEKMVLSESDPDLKKMAEEEAGELRGKINDLETVVPPLVGGHNSAAVRPGTRPGPTNECYLEIRAGTGGDEASIFAEDLKQMYTKFTQLRGWMSADLSSGRNIVLKIKGQNCFDVLKNESGVHRVQRVPTTEKSGRIHTSTATVAVMPVASPVEVELNSGDVKIDFFRGGGHGGQNVNKVETGVRLTHIPTGVVVECVEERFQQRNREIAEQMLRSKLCTLMQEQQAASVNELRASQVGRGERNEKIKTYNFPQDRLTDHRINVSYHNLPKIMNGEIPGLQ